MSRLLHLAGAALALVATLAGAEDPPRPPSLKTVPVPEPANLADFVRDRQAAIVLGKSLFWDMQVGSDGVQACASCHFNAGADSRSRNQLNPGPDGFDGGHGPNRELTASDFPLSPASNDVVSSQGVVRMLFQGVGGAVDRTRVVPDPDGFRIGRSNVRRVEPRNTPTVVNTVFNFRNFWDGRAQNVFNGVNDLGDRDPDANVYRADDPDDPRPVRVRLEDASLASQAVGPPVSTTEMSAAGRTFAHIGRKFRRDAPRVHALRPLAHQLVHPQDGVLGPLSRHPLPGLRVPSYETLIAAAFRPEWWRSSRLVQVHPDGSTQAIAGRDGDPTTSEYTLIEYNFALFFGLAVQLYEATLVADDSSWDRFMDGDAAAVSAAAIHGADLFRSQDRGRCINCHEGAELTGASVRRVRESPTRWVPGGAGPGSRVQ